MVAEHHQAKPTELHEQKHENQAEFKFYSRKGHVPQTSASTALGWFTCTTAGKDSTTVCWEWSPRIAPWPDKPNLNRWGDHTMTLWGVPKALKVLPRHSLAAAPPPVSGRISSGLLGTLTFYKMEQLILPFTRRSTQLPQLHLWANMTFSRLSMKVSSCAWRQGGRATDFKHALHCRGTKYPRIPPFSAM